MKDIKQKITKKIKNDGFTGLIKDGFPWLYRKKGGRIIKNLTHRAYIKIKYNKNSTNQYDKYIHIDPDDIEYYLLNSSENFVTSYCKKDSHKKVPLHELEKGIINPVYAGIVFSGDWDIYKKSYCYDRVYNSFRKHHNKEKTLLETEYGSQYKIRGTIHNRREYAKKKVNKKLKLYKNIKKHGFLTQHDLGKKRVTPVYIRPWPITVNIGRNGEIISNNTAHNRIAICKILNINKVPVLVVARHKMWQEIRKELWDKKANSDDNIRPELKKYINHPDII